MKKIIVSLIVLVTSIAIANAQSAQCATIVQNALSEIGTNCANLDTNNACYGFVDVDAEFFEFVDLDDIDFTEPADRAFLAEIANITTVPLSTATGDWGISVLRLTANVPNALPGQGVVFIVLGDVELTNEVIEEIQYIAESTVTVEVADSASLLSFPPGWGNRRSEEVGTLGSNETVEADAISEDGQWVRVAFISERTDTSNRPTAWINVADLTESDLSELVVINPESRTPVQVFTLATGLEQPPCDEQPESQLVIQGPSTLEVELTGNCLDFRLTSTVAVLGRQLSDDAYFISLTPVTGAVTIPNPSDPDNLDEAIVINAGQFIELEIPCSRDPITGLLVVDPSWLEIFADIKAAFDAATENGQNYIGSTTVESLSRLERLPENLLNYPLEDNTPIIIRPSGIGSPIPQFQTFTPSN